MIGDYTDLIQKFLDNKYKFKTFNTYDYKKSGQIILRHDIDFDCKLAKEMAIVEKNLGIKSTYFFLLTNNNYNLISEKNQKHVKEIIRLGHEVSIHFDDSLYSNFNQGLNYEKMIFEMTFGLKINIISLHRPSSEILNKLSKKKISVKTTYNNIFFRKTKYFSDSRGEFRFGNPLDSEEFKNNENIQLLIHPIWWTLRGTNKSEILKSLKKNWIAQDEENLSNSLDFYEK